jgi:Domain of unknown function (DUF4169)
MSNVINLGRARKRKREGAEKRRADENAIRHGRTKADEQRERMEQAKLRATVDGARREPTAALTLVPADARPAADPRPPTSDDEPEA